MITIEHSCGKQADIAELKSDVKAIFKRIDEQVMLAKAVYDLVAEVKVMNVRLAGLALAQDQFKKDVDALKAYSGKKWEAMIRAAISAIVSGLIAYMLLRSGLSY